MNEEEVETLDESVFATICKKHMTCERTIRNQQYHEIVIPEEVLDGIQKLQTGVEESKLAKINEELLTWPEDFNVFRKLEKILKRREEPFNGKGKIDWAHAETLSIWYYFTRW